MPDGAGSRQPRRAILIPETRHHGAARRLDRGDSSSEIAPKLGEISAALGPKAPDEGSGRPQIGASPPLAHRWRSDVHTSELQSLMRSSYALFGLEKKNNCTHLTNANRVCKIVLENKTNT